VEHPLERVARPPGPIHSRYTHDQTWPVTRIESSAHTRVRGRQE